MNYNTYHRFRKIEPTLHLFFWVMVLFYPYIKNFGWEGDYSWNLGHELLALLFNMIPTYVMYWWFFPQKNKKFAIPKVILLFIFIETVYFHLDSSFHPGDIHPRWGMFLSAIVRYSALSVAFFGLYSIKQLYQKQLEIDAVIREKQVAELRILKAQINPHFLFNTLNTIYASALDKEDKTPDLLLKLSHSFRYFLTEGQKEHVSLKKEIQHLKDYIQLQEERLSNKIIVQWSENIDNYAQNIPPLLLISLVENAFKYSSILRGKNHQVKLTITLKKNFFSFSCENPFKDNALREIDPNWKENGIGLQNTRKRLELLFPNCHELDINKTNNYFRVLLNIKL
ncbi:sensor histidine kinase [Xanthovirga aplysinae]|uniref:sensor histidine kinase n=1 Tax=Xanthovirga aplysinae TaxID=2529853 RepID=UPI0012BC94F1|nr:histidine kinase [Xanthovirga aplysinae]MTI32938.1 GHKL domain-containing protein [Xanthovirga aplysinae]